MSAVATAVVGGAVIGGIASNRAADRAADATEDAADSTNATNWRMYEQTRADNLGRMQTSEDALNRLASLYGLPVRRSVLTAPTNQYSSSFDGALVENRGGVPHMNAELYANDPIYRQAWDETLARHQRDWGSGYTDHSDFGALEYDLRSAMSSNPAYQNRQQQTGVTIDNDTGQVVGENDWSLLFDSPDYQFAYDEGLRATNNSLAARGLSNSGAALKELTRYGQGMASQQLGNYMNRLASIAGIGQTASNAVTSAGANAASNIGAANMAAGDARASSYIARGNSVNNLINQGVGALSLAQLQNNGGWSSGVTGSGNPYTTNGAGTAMIGYS